MAVRRNNVSPLQNDDVYTDEQWNQDIQEISKTIQVVGTISNEIGHEIRKQNEILNQLSVQYQHGISAIQSLNKKLKKIFGMTNFSPMTMMFFFTIAVILFLWVYWKIKA